MLAVATRGQLTTVVVQDVQARQRIAAMLAAAKYPVPDMLPTTMMFPSMHGVKSGDSPGFSNAGHRAHVLQLAACRGADPPLALPLPHTVRINKMRERGVWLACVVLPALHLKLRCAVTALFMSRSPCRLSLPPSHSPCYLCPAADGIGMSASDWPRGCLGFAINLVRPVHQGHRATILASQLNNVLVFETLKDAEQYKEFTSQVRLGCCAGCRAAGWLLLHVRQVQGTHFTLCNVAEAAYGNGHIPDAGWRPNPVQRCSQRCQLPGAAAGQVGRAVWEQLLTGAGELV